MNKSNIINVSDCEKNNLNANVLECARLILSERSRTCSFLLEQQTVYLSYLK